MQSVDQANYTRRDLTATMRQANIIALALIVPISLLMIPFIWRWGWFNEVNFDVWTFLISLVVVAISIVVHELIHGLAWCLAGRVPWSAIKFGFQVKTFTPYAHCKVPLPVNAYRIGAAAPGIILGVIPIIVATLNGSGWLAAFGWFMLVSAGGDILILWLLRNVPPDRLVEDHPSEAGCVVLEPA